FSWSSRTPPWRSPSRIEATCSRPAPSPSRAPPPSFPTTPTFPAPTSVNSRPGLRAWMLLALVLLAAAAVRLRLLEAALDRDEGEDAYIAPLLLQGIPPCPTAYHAKLPGVYAAYALALALFGRSIAGIHLGLLVVNAATSVLVFLVASRLFNRTVAVSAAAVFAVLSLSPRLQGLAAYAEHFLLLPALAGGAAPVPG